ncbi:MAG: glycoside hydrolase family 20 zincin-like fold domain-containing protein [Flavobacteriaceae bacterium]
MKHVLRIVLLLIMFSSCKKNKTEDNFILLPSVKHADFNGEYSVFNHESQFIFYSKSNELPVLLNKSFKFKKGNNQNHNLTFEINNELELADEGYHLNISKKSIEIIAKDEAGLFYSFNSLNQLMTDSKDQNINLPIVFVKDHPSLKYRSIHIDVKHHTEKKDYYFKLIDQLASIKINGIIMEFEDKLRYERRPTIAAPDSFSISWWRKLSKYANDRNIKISPLIQGLGHASFILKHDNYKKLRDVSDNDWSFNPLDNETYDIQFDLYQDAIEATPFGQFLHVGGDEVRVIDRDGKKGFELNLIWLNKVSEFAKKNNRTPIFWDDMYLKHGGVWNVTRNTKLSKKEVEVIWEKNKTQLTEYIDEFPKNCIYMRWNYFYPWAEGNLKTIDWYKENGMKVMGATAGQTRWILMPQDYSNIESIKSFSLTSVSKKLDGLLLTLWDDDSPHFELYKRGIYAFAEYTWSGSELSTKDFKSNFKHRFFSPSLSSEKFEFIDELDKPVRDWGNLFIIEKKHRNQITKASSPLKSHIIELPEFNNPAKWNEKFEQKISTAKKHIENLKKIIKKIKHQQTKTVRGNYTLEVYEQVALLTKFSYETFVLISELDNDLNNLSLLQEKETEFLSIRNNFEKVYAKSRNINKPENYILDQDHHNHTANQTLNMDWQFIAEIKLFEKINLTYN